MDKFKKTIGNYVIELNRNLITVKERNGELLKAKEVRGCDALATFHRTVKAAKVQVDKKSIGKLVKS